MCQTCKRWRRFKPKVGVSRYGYCSAKPKQNPIWREVEYPTPDGPHRLSASPLMPDIDGEGCKARVPT